MGKATEALQSLEYEKLRAGLKARSSESPSKTQVTLRTVPMHRTTLRLYLPG